MNSSLAIAEEVRARQAAAMQDMRQLEAASQHILDQTQHLRGGVELVLHYERRGDVLLRRLLGKSFALSDALTYGAAALGIVAMTTSVAIAALRVPLMALLVSSLILERLLLQWLHGALTERPDGAVVVDLAAWTPLAHLLLPAPLHVLHIKWCVRGAALLAASYLWVSGWVRQRHQRHAVHEALRNMEQQIQALSSQCGAVLQHHQALLLQTRRPYADEAAPSLHLHQPRFEPDRQQHHQQHHYHSQMQQQQQQRLQQHQVHRQPDQTQPRRAAQRYSRYDGRSEDLPDESLPQHPAALHSPPLHSQLLHPLPSYSHQQSGSHPHAPRHWPSGFAPDAHHRPSSVVPDVQHSYSSMCLTPTSAAAAAAGATAGGIMLGGTPGGPHGSTANMSAGRHAGSEQREWQAAGDRITGNASAAVSCLPPSSCPDSPHDDGPAAAALPNARPHVFAPAIDAYHDPATLRPCLHLDSELSGMAGAPPEATLSLCRSPSAAGAVTPIAAEAAASSQPPAMMGMATTSKPDQIVAASDVRLGLGRWVRSASGSGDDNGGGGSGKRPRDGLAAAADDDARCGEPCAADRASLEGGCLLDKGDLDRSVRRKI